MSNRSWMSRLVGRSPQGGKQAPAGPPWAEGSAGDDGEYRRHRDQGLPGARSRPYRRGDEGAWSRREM